MNVTDNLRKEYPMDFAESNKQKSEAITKAKQVLSPGSSDCPDAPVMWNAAMVRKAIAELRSIAADASHYCYFGTSVALEKVASELECDSRQTKRERQLAGERDR
jgi:hypothetical protein